MAQVFGFPFERLARVTRAEVARGNAAARWLGVAPAGGAHVAALLGAPPLARVVAGRSPPWPPGECVRVAVRRDGASLAISVHDGVARRLAQRLLGGPVELMAPRPADATERAVWAVIVAAALEDLGVPGEVWPALDEPDEPRGDGADGIELAVTVGTETFTIGVVWPRELTTRVAPPRAPAPWLAATALDLVIALGRCALPRSALAEIAVRDVITLEPPLGGHLELVWSGGRVGLRAAPGAVEAEVATGYGVRDMALPDEAHLELTVALGTTRVSLRALSELAVGQVVALGRPLAGPFELRAEGRVIGRGELVDVEGELGVRVVSLGE